MKAKQGATFRIGVDIGGTFTDIVFYGSDGSVFSSKVPSSADDYSRAIGDSIERTLAQKEISAQSVDRISHATTIATNSILTRQGAKTGLITTKGFRDVLEIGRLRMPQLYNLKWEKPKPLVERQLRLEVDERAGSRGEILSPLSESSVTRAGKQLLQAGVESIAVCLINSFANARHEQKVREILGQIGPDWDISISADVLPEIREYERTSTTVINAYIKPVVRRYLAALRQRFNAIGIDVDLLIMQSNGGVITANAAAERPIHIIESGPAAGVMAALAEGCRSGHQNLLTFDMGGTTAKASIIEGGRVARASELEVGGGVTSASWLTKGSGYLLRIPAIDIAEVGAGGGSVAWIDSGGALNVGPQSAGAVPGPVCYDQGGKQPTITDANVVLGYLNPDFLVGGELELDFDKACAAVGDQICTPLRVSLLEGAFGIHQVGNAKMMRAVRSVSIERGRDPRNFTLIAFGGSGPVHAVQLAKTLEISRILIPRAPGLFSATGLLQTEVQQYYTRSLLRKTEGLAAGEVLACYKTLEHEALADLEREGFDAQAITLARSADLRYAGQSFELGVAVAPGHLDAADLAGLSKAFEEEHEQTYGHRAAGDPVEIVNLRLVATVSGTTVELARSDSPAFDRPSAAVQPAPRSELSRKAYFGPVVGEVSVPVVERQAIATQPEPGPLIVEE